MKRLRAICPLLLLTLVLCLPAKAHGGSITVPFHNDWELVVSMNGDGSGSLLTPLGYKLDNNGTPSVSFQAQGHQTMTVTATYTGSAKGEPFFDVWNYDAGPTLEYTAQPTVKEGKFTAEQWYGETDASGYAHGWTAVVSLELRTVDGVPVPGTSVENYLSFGIRQFRHAWIDYDRLGVSDILAGTSTTTLLPVDAESYTLRVESPLAIDPGTAVTSAYVSGGYAGYAPFFLTCPLSAFDSGPVSGKITAEGGNAPPISRIVSLPFARVIRSDWGVEHQDQLSGEWRSISNSKVLYKGDKLRMQPQVDGSTIRLPSVAVQFADGQIREVTLEPGYDQSKAGQVIIEIGQGSLLAREVCWTVKFTNFIQERTSNPREYAKEFVWDTMSSALMNLVAPGTVWPIRKVSSELIEYGLESVYTGTGGHDAPRPAIETLMAESQAGYADVRNAVSSQRATAHAVMTIKSDGSMAVETRLGTHRAVNAAQQTRLLPPRSRIEHKSSFGQVATLPFEATSTFGTFAMSPTGSIDTRTPLLSFTYSGYGSRYAPETLDVRINGVLARQFTTQKEASATHKIPLRSALVQGGNTVEATIIEAQTGRKFLAATLFASGTPAPPQTVVTIPGATSMLLSWATSQERGLEGYHIYKGDTAATVTTRLTPSPVSGSAYALYAATDPGLAAGAYYAVTAVVSGVESALSTPVQGSLAGPAAALPASVTDLAAITAFDRVSLNFTPPAGTIAFRLARPGLDPLVFRSPPFVDTTAARGTPYTYTLTPLGLDLAPGTPAETTATIAAATPPPVPTGATAYAADAEGKTWDLRWDPVQVAGVVGVNVYEAKNDGVFAKVTATPVTGTTLARSLSASGVYAWRILAVSSTGVESTEGPILCGGYAPKAGLGTAAGSAIMLLLQH